MNPEARQLSDKQKQPRTNFLGEFEKIKAKAFDIRIL